MRRRVGGEGPRVKGDRDEEAALRGPTLRDKLTLPPRQRATNRPMRTFGFAFALLLGLVGQAAASCYSVRITGCGKEVRICVVGPGPEKAEAKALQAWKKQSKCATAVVAASFANCGERADDKCALKL